VSPRLPLELADVMIRQIHAIGLSLAEADSVVTGPAPNQLEAAVAQFDALVRELQRVALTERATFGGDPPPEPFPL